MTDTGKVSETAGVMGSDVASVISAMGGAETAGPRGANPVACSHDGGGDLPRASNGGGGSSGSSAGGDSIGTTDRRFETAGGMKGGGASPASGKPSNQL